MVLDRQQIQELSEELDQAIQNDYPNVASVEEDINSKLDRQNSLNKDDLKRIIEWKMASQGGRASNNKERIEKASEDVIRDVTRAGLAASRPKLQVKILSSLPGIGSATATVILAFNDPGNYAVGDRYINEEFLGEEKAVTPSNYEIFLEELEKVCPEDMSLRLVEKAYYRAKEK